MDTNQNTANNYQINTFTKGMNSDTSYDMIGADQYLFGLNIRITNNTLLFNATNSNNTEMVVAPIQIGLRSGVIEPNVDSILAVDSIDNLGVIIIKSGNRWKVLKAVYNEDANTITFSTIYTSTHAPERDRFSTVMIKEVEDVVKVYIADGQGSPICLFVEGGISANDTDEEYLRSYFPYTKAKILKTVGNLKTQQIQYAYRFYTRYAWVSKISPLTNKIQVINDSRDSEIGNAEDTTTNIGFNVFIKKPDINIFDHVLLFRISYIKYRQEPQIHLIYDEQITSDSFTEDRTFDGEYLTITDTGSIDLLLYSLDEFSAMYTQTLCPLIIEANQNYLFYGNVKDLTIIDNQDLSNLGVNIYQAKASIKINEHSDGQVPGVDNPVNVDYDSGTGGELNKIWHTDGQSSTKLDPILIGLYLQNCGIKYELESGKKAKATYDDIFVSSMLRSLRRDEQYNYGIVFYDKYGKRSNVKQINPITTDSDYKSISTYTYPYGIYVDIDLNNIDSEVAENIKGFEIVRLEKNYNNTKNLLLVALSRPVRQGKWNDGDYRTPYYPNTFLSTLFFYGWWKHLLTDNFNYPELWNQYFDRNLQNVENFRLYLAFSPTINLFRQDCLLNLSGAECTLLPILFRNEENILSRSVAINNMGSQIDLVFASTGTYDDIEFTSAINNNPGVHKIEDGIYIFSNDQFDRNYQSLSKVDKYGMSALFTLSQITDISNDSCKIKNVKDVKNPNWEDAFSNILYSGSGSEIVVQDAIKQYKSYITNIGQFEYNNWVSGGKYNLAVSENESRSQPGNNGQDHWDGYVALQSWVYHPKSYRENFKQHGAFEGWIGPGPVCLLLETEQPGENNALSVLVYRGNANESKMGTIVCNIQHTLTSNDVIKTDPYFGFGNYFEWPTGQKQFSCYVFDGDVYNDYAEFVNMFKTYDFIDQLETLPSGLVIYYMPIESEINVKFDYGMNYRNTKSNNLLLEPGKIDGVVTQERPLHQYNRVYSDNNSSINYFYVSPKDKAVTQYPQRIAYSQLKTNGEFIDNWLIFRPADFIDTDSRYGEVTELLSRDNNLYFWQTGAFGKLSVNERSLVTDDNGETIQLGQGGVLQRVDYLSTKYGMRSQDHCATNTEDAVYWIDILNKAIVTCKQNSVANYGELLNVLNIINQYIDINNRPTIHYDLLTNELLCKCLNKDDIHAQLVFNTKYNIATSVYTREYDNIINFNNVLVGIHNTALARYNYLQEYKNQLSPTILKFVVNSSASLAKVFDNQKVVILGREGVENEAYDKVQNYYLNSKNPDTVPYTALKEYRFETDLYTTELKPRAVTDREGNICYDIPRIGNTDWEKDWGKRMRGKWMVETITDLNPMLTHCISHIITKFRQSYS